jgi:DnaK suppressor protein
MATKKKTTTKKKPAAGKKTVKTVKPAKKINVRKKAQKKKQMQKTVKEKTKKVSKPAKKTVRKKVKAKALKASARLIEAKKKKPSPRVKVTRVARKTQPVTTHTAAPLTTLRKELLKKQLIEKREEIVREAKSEIAKYITGEANQLVETALDDGDWSVIDVSADVNIRRLETHRQRLLGIDDALMKLREGTYGVCEGCGGDISAERLRVLPFAIFCIDCQERKEQLEKVEREEIIP